MSMKKMATLFGLLSGLVSAAHGESNLREEGAGDYVVLLHGLGRTRLSMSRIERVLQRQNYRVINVSYPSTRLSIEAAAQEALTKTLNEQVRDSSVRVHFVTHSLGGILLRQYLSSRRIENLGRVVMLAPPNQGSELVDKLKKNWLYQFATGPSGQQLGTDEDSVPRRLSAVNFELGVIAGTGSLNPIFSRCLPGLDDGKVSVESTKVRGMRDFLVVPYSHTWMSGRKPVVQSIVSFIQTGQFTQPRPFKL
jgi:triacylglycerol lipase